MLKEKSRQFLKSVGCFLLTASLLMTSGVQDVSAGFSGFAGGNALVTIKFKTRTNRGTNTSTDVTSFLTGRKLVGTGWVIGLARYDTSRDSGYEALTPSELANSYKNGVLVYNSGASYTPCSNGHTSLKNEITGHNLPIGYNVLINSGYYFQDLEFRLKQYNTSNVELFNRGYEVQSVTNSDEKMSCVNFTNQVGSSSNTKLQAIGNSDGGKVPVSAVYPADVSDQDGVIFGVGKLDYSHVSGYPTSTINGETTTYKDKYKVSFEYKYYKGYVSDVFDKLVEWTDDNFYSNLGLTDFPKTTINVVSSACFYNNFCDWTSIPGVLLNGIFNLSWIHINGILPDTNKSNHFYNDGDYIFKSDFDTIPSTQSREYFDSYNRGAIQQDVIYDTVNTFVGGSSMSLGDIKEYEKVGNGDVEESTSSASDAESDAKDSALDDLIDEITQPNITRIEDIFDTSRYNERMWNYGDKADASETAKDNLACVWAARVNYKVQGGTEPIGVAVTPTHTGYSSSGTSYYNMQYNKYSQGGKVTINSGSSSRSNFDNGLYNGAGNFRFGGSDSTRYGEQSLEHWYESSVDATTATLNSNSVKTFPKITSDNTDVFKKVLSMPTGTSSGPLKIDANCNANHVSSTIGEDIAKFNDLWAVKDGTPNPNSDLNKAEYREELFDNLRNLKGSDFKDSDGNVITKDNFVYNNVAGTGMSEDWIYIITIVPVVLIENYLSGTSELEHALDTNNSTNKRGQTVIAAYPSYEFIQYDGTLNGNGGSGCVGRQTMGTDSYSIGSYLAIFSGMAGIYATGHKQYMAKECGHPGWDVDVAAGLRGHVGDTMTLSGTIHDYNSGNNGNLSVSGSVSFGQVHKIYPDKDMNLEPDNNIIEEPDFKGFLVYGANLDMTVRLTSNVTAYLDSTNFNSAEEKDYEDVNYSNLGLRNYILNDEEERNNLKLDKKPYDVDLGFEYEHKGVRYWYSNKKNYGSDEKKLFRTVLTKNIATEEITGIEVNSSNKATEYNDYDVLNESSQFYIKSRNNVSSEVGSEANWITVYTPTGGGHLHNIIQRVKSGAKVGYRGEDIGGFISFGKRYTTEVTYGSDSTKGQTLAASLYRKICKYDKDSSSWTGDWIGGGFVKYTEQDGVNKSINRYIDRKKNRAGYTPLKQRAMVFAAKMLLNGVELTDTKDNDGNPLSYGSSLSNTSLEDVTTGSVASREVGTPAGDPHPGSFVIKGNTTNGYKVSGSGQFATVSVQVYEKRKVNKSYLKVFDVRVDDEGNFEEVDYESGWVPSVNEYYYDEESYIDWTSDSAQHDYNIKLITDRDDAEIANSVDGAKYINYLAVPNNKAYSHGNSPLTSSDITSSCYKVDDLISALNIDESDDTTGKVLKNRVNETGINVGTSPENYGYTIYVIRYYTKYKYYENPSEGEEKGEITSDSALYLEDYEISHVYPNIYNANDASASTIKDRYIKTSQAYTYKKGSNETNHSWVKDYGDTGEVIFDESDKYSEILSDANRYIWQNRLSSTECKSIVGKYDTTGVYVDNNHNDNFGVYGGYKFSPIMGSYLFPTWSYPQNSMLAIPFVDTLIRGSNVPLGYAVVLSRDIANDKVVISGLTKSTVMHSADGYNDAMRNAFISYLSASGVIKKGEDASIKDTPQNDDAIKHTDVGANDTIATRDTNHRSTSATNTQSIRYGSDVDSDNSVASQDTQSTYTWHKVLDRITFTGGWQKSETDYKKAEVYGDDLSTVIEESTLIKNNLYGEKFGIGQSVILKHDVNSAVSELKTLACNKDRHGFRSHGFIGNIDVYQYYYKYYTGSRPVGGTTASTKDEVLGGTNRRGATATPPSRDYLFEAKDYFTAYSGTASKKGQLPVYTDTNGAYTQAYRMVHDLIVNFYPEVMMSMQVPALEDITIETGVKDADDKSVTEQKTQLRQLLLSEDKTTVTQNDYYNDTIWTIGEYIRKTKLTSLYFVSIKSSGNTDTESQLYSDNSTSNANSNALGNNIPSLYAGADVSLTVKPKFTIWTYGYSLDLINKAYDDNNNIVSREAQSHGDAALNFTYKAIVNDEVDIYTAWGNPATPSTRDALKSDFEDFTKMVGMSLESDITLQTVNQTSFNNGIIEKDTSLNKEEYQNFSTSVGKLDSNPVNNGNKELVYTLEVRHGKLVEDPSTISGKSVEALIRQMAVDYYGIENSGSILATERVTDAQYSAMRDMLNSSGMVASIVESIESDTDDDNTSTVIGHKILGDVLTNAKDLGSFKQNEHGTIEGKWYDERVKTFVIRRFFQESKLDSIVLDDKLDYNMGMSSNGGNDNTQNGYKSKTYSWFMNLYMDYKLIDSSKLANPANADYFTRDGVYGTNADNWYSPSRNNNDSAYKAGTGLIRNLYLPNVDFNIVSDAVAN